MTEILYYVVMVAFLGSYVFSKQRQNSLIPATYDEAVKKNQDENWHLKNSRLVGSAFLWKFVTLVLLFPLAVHDAQGIVAAIAVDFQQSGDWYFQFFRWGMWLFMGTLTFSWALHISCYEFRVFVLLMSGLAFYVGWVSFLVAANPIIGWLLDYPFSIPIICIVGLVWGIWRRFQPRVGRLCGSGET